MGYLEDREKQAHLEYENTVNAAVKKRDDVIAAIAVLRGDSVVNIPPPRPSVRTIGGDKKKNKRGGKRPSVRKEGTVVDIVKGTATVMQGEYTGAEAFKELPKVYPGVTMSEKAFQDKLCRLATLPDSGIVVSQDRRGRIPAKYKNI